jgi:hypothetical protein
VASPMTSSDDQAASGSASFLKCPRCGLSVTPRASWLTIEHCPRCIARDRTPVKLIRSPLPAVEHYDFRPNARRAPTDQAPFPVDSGGDFVTGGVRPRSSGAYDGARGAGTLPVWAVWNDRVKQRYTIGVEEELTNAPWYGPRAGAVQ